MKFTGLILICASSCLALILPAIGAIQFPKLNQTTHPTRATGGIPASFPFDVQNIPAHNPNNPSWGQPASQRDFLPNSNNITNSPFPSAIFPSGSPTQTPLAAPVAPATPVADAAPDGNKLGMGIWLLLAPVCLVGLAMWTFSPNPTGR